ncbi:MAG: cation:proton antiporter [Gemmatimonadota bacterium]|nr:cation:proton antiporter [Gemmatimonadota bacterium]
MTRRLFVIVLLIGGALLMEPLRVPTEGVIAPRSLFLFGLLLLTADSLGVLAARLGLPRILGYLIAGIALGPSALGLVPATVISDLSMTNRLALGLIGLLAGVELKLSDVRERWRTIAAMLLCQTAAVLVLLVPTIVVGREFVPFVAGLGWQQALLLAFLFSTLLAVNSPIVTIALLSETEADGPVARTTLGVVLVADVVIVILFTVALSLAQAGFAKGEVHVLTVLRSLMWDVSGSFLVGALIGVAFAAYLRFVRREIVVFAVVMVFATAALANALDFELLLTLVVAGFLIRNVAPVNADPLTQALHNTANPVFVIFFALAGADLHLREAAPLAFVILALAGLRMLGVYAGTRLGARWAGAEDAVRRYGWMGLVSQSGVALGLALLVADRFPDIGLAMQTTVVGVIAVNETVGPILFRRALSRAGELRPESARTGEANPLPAPAAPAP